MKSSGASSESMFLGGAAERGVVVSISAASNIMLVALFLCFI